MSKEIFGRFLRTMNEKNGNAVLMAKRYLEGIRLNLEKRIAYEKSRFIRAFFVIAENITFSINAGSARSYVVMACITALVFGINALHLDQAGIIQALGISGGTDQPGYGVSGMALNSVTPAFSNLSEAGETFLATLSGWQESVATSTQASGLTQTSGSAIFSYDAAQGDTVQSVAQKFNISENTVRWVNNLKSDDLSVGQHLLILPLSGALHRVAQGETVESIAALYDSTADRIRTANHLSDTDTVYSGEALIVPGGDSALNVSPALATTTLTMQQDIFFKIPTTGWNWGKLHADNAVDIANACGTPVYASAQGFVTQAQSDGWNNGYGSYVAIDHGNGIETVYAHLSAVFVSSGAFVHSGDMIGTTGSTGRVDGISGCHLHFEVHGAPNPFARQ